MSDKRPPVRQPPRRSARDLSAEADMMRPGPAAKGGRTNVAALSHNGRPSGTYGLSKDE